MKRLLALALLSLFLLGCAPKEEKHTAVWYDQFDTVIQLTAYASEAEFSALQAAAYQLCGRYAGLFTIYDDYSEPNLKTINESRGAAVTVAPEIMALLSLSKDLHAATGGAVNVCMGSVLSLWHEYREAGTLDPASAQLPPKADLLAAAKHCDIEDLLLDETACTVTLLDPEMRLDAGAIAKGFAAQAVADALVKEGYESFLLSMGGDVVAVGTKPQREAWQVGVQDPKETSSLLLTRKLRDASLVTSGDYQRYYTVDGARYCHIIDPHTLYPAARYASVTVWAKDSGVADGLSTALFILPRRQGEALLKAYGAEALWVYPDGGMYESAGFSPPA